MIQQQTEARHLIFKYILRTCQGFKLFCLPRVYVCVAALGYIGYIDFDSKTKREMLCQDIAAHRNVNRQ